jgi:uncharacterized damage-inducible protein DinB
MDTTLVEFFKHNLWANQRLLQACQACSDAQLDAGAVGTYGSIHNTLVHLLAAEERYVNLLGGWQSGGQEPERPLRESEGFPGFDELLARAQASGEALIQIATDDPYTELLQGTYGDKPYTMRTIVPLVQAINHAHEHRTHVMTILTQQGIEPPDLSGWAFGEATGATE